MLLRQARAGMKIRAARRVKDPDLRKSEDDTRESEHGLRTLVEHAADAFFVHDWVGRFLDVNQRACESLGYSRDELLKMTVMDVGQDDNLVRLQSIWGRVRHNEPFTVDAYHTRKDVRLKFA
jgi:PAS domain S-box-containing protein